MARQNHERPTTYIRPISSTIARQSSAVVTDEGVLTAFRDRDENEIRDIYTSRLENGAWTVSYTHLPSPRD